MQKSDQAEPAFSPFEIKLNAFLDRLEKFAAKIIKPILGDFKEAVDQMEP